jgi:hypothetical protein
MVDHRAIVRLQREVGEAFGGVLIGHHDLVHAASGKVVGEMDPPVVARAAGVPQTGGIDQADPSRARRGGARWRAWCRNQFA